MATITLSTEYYYQDTTGGVSKIVGWDGIYYRIGRYQFTSPAGGASHVKVSFKDMRFISGTDLAHSKMCFYIGTSSTSHVGANANSSYTGTITITENSNAVGYDFTGEADIVLLSGTTYYLWIFSNAANSSLQYCHFSAELATKQITTSGSAGFVYIDNGGGTTSSDNNADSSSLTLSNPTFYYDGQSVSDMQVVGSTNTNYRIVRYEFTAPSEGASHVQLDITGTFFFNSDTDNAHPHNHNFCFYIGTSSSSHAAANSSSPYTGRLTMTWADDWTNASIFTGEADISLNPNTKYYVWIFSISELHSGVWAIYNFDETYTTALITTSGSTSSSGNNASFDKYQVYIDNGTSWDLYLPYIDNGTGWDICG